MESFDAIVTKSDGTGKSLQRIIQFFRSFAQRELEYGQKLIQSSNLAPSKEGGSLVSQEDVVHQFDAGSVILSWDLFQRQLHERGARCVKTAAEVEQALEELDVWTRDNSTSKKHMIDELYKLKKEVGEYMQAVKRTHTSQNAACAEADKCVLEYKSNNAEASQLKKKAKLVVERAGKAIKEYQKAVADANKFRLQCAVRFVPDLLAEFRVFEESRMSAIKTVFGRLQTSLSGAGPSNPAWANLSKLILDIDPVSIGAAMAQIDLAPLRVPLEAAPFDAHHVDFLKSRTMRLKGTEEIAPVSHNAPSAAASVSAPANMMAPMASASSAASVSGAAAQMYGNPPSSLMSSSGGERLEESRGDLHRHESAPHFAEVMPNTVVALGVESKREILRTQLAQLQTSIIAEKRSLQDLFSLIRFYGGCATAQGKAKEEYEVVKKRFENLLGARKQLFSAMERVGTTPSVLSTLRDRSRYAAAPNSTELLSPNSVSKSVSAPSMHQAQLNLPTAPAPSTPSTASNLVRGLCLYSYTAATAKELSFRKGEVLVVRDEDDSGWWYVENNSNVLGFVPANFLRKLAPGETPVPPREKKKKVDRDGNTAVL